MESTQTTQSIETHENRLDLKLYLGLSIQRGDHNELISESELDSFLSRIVARAFPDGFTSYRGVGSWRDPDSDQIITEPCEIVEIIAPDNFGTSAIKAGAIASAWDKQFNQHSVLMTTHAIEAKFI